MFSFVVVVVVVVDVVVAGRHSDAGGKRPSRTPFVLIMIVDFLRRAVSSVGLLRRRSFTSVSSVGLLRRSAMSVFHVVGLLRRSALSLSLIHI